MEWELIATWIGLLFTIGGFVYSMGKQAQKIHNQQERIEALEAEQKATSQLPIKLAALETNINYLVREMTDIKALLIKTLTGDK